ncbi:gluconolaconase [Variovorax sp. WS11]|uniref:SMP-30/gluconolactonase/LRE family protein n=1 Tax=Variovorax sp. WS11 TaxID=1105204 RepID=UPI000D0D5498|nr:SMP-30/gluconolactonase/LRE family protein [Variovorax sp. WS11]NDZ14828.1 SMP-30/gluconolactonase/LRE family protein [Variovorax sp. WS11]PSL85655.1 gluconolaconase [Variovorax sp. WS11]
MAIEIRRIGDTKDLLGESPCWDAPAGALCWIDSLAGTLRRMRPATGAIEQHSLPAPVGSIAPCESGAVVAALKNGFARYDFATRELEVIASIDVDHPDVRLNDGKCDPWGNFVAGTMHINRQPGDAILGGVYRLRPDRSVEKIADGFGLTNGPCFGLDGRTLYVADSTVRTIWAYDYAPDAPLANRRVFAQTEDFGSGPDGATVDAQGFVWTVLPRIGKMARFAPDGRLDCMVELPATYPTSLCFGGLRFDVAYVTSISRSTHLAGERVQDGGLFEVRGLPAGGVAPHRFADGH